MALHSTTNLLMRLKAMFQIFILSFIFLIYPYPTEGATLIDGKLEDMMRLAGGDYLSEQKDFFFTTQQYQNGTDLIRYVNNIIITNGIHDPILNLAAKKSSIALSQGLGTFINRTDDIYEMWVRVPGELPKSNHPIRFKIDSGELEFRNNGKQQNQWVKICDVKLRKGEHKIRLEQSNVLDRADQKNPDLSEHEEIIFLPMSEMRKYENQIFEKNLVYLFFRKTYEKDECLEDNFQSYRLRSGNFYIPKISKCNIRALIESERILTLNGKVASSFAQVVGSTSKNGIEGWHVVQSNNVRYKLCSSYKGLIAKLFLSKGANVTEKIVLSKEIAGKKLLKESPYLICSLVNNSRILDTEIAVWLENQDSGLIKKVTLYPDKEIYIANVLEKIRNDFTREALTKLKLTRIDLVIKKKDGFEATPIGIQGYYEFGLTSLVLLKNMPFLLENEDILADYNSLNAIYFLDSKGMLRKVSSFEEVPSEIKYVYKILVANFIDLSKEPILSFNFNVPQLSAYNSDLLFVHLLIDLDGDGQADVNMPFLANSVPIKKSLRHFDLDVFREIHKKFPNRKYYKVVAIGIRPSGDQEIFFQSFRRKTLLRFEHNNFKIADLGRECPIFKIDSKTYKLKDALQTAGDNKRIWVEYKGINLQQGQHSFQPLISKKLKLEMVEIKTNNEFTGIPLSEPQIKMRKINPALFIVNVRNATRPFTLVLDQSFHPGWKAYRPLQPSDVHGKKYPLLSGFDQNNKTEISDHFVINGYANGWVVPLDHTATQNSEKDDLQLLIEFTPQKWVERGALISFISLLGCTIYLIQYWIKRKGRNTK